MNPENTQTRSPENLTRRQKLLRRVGLPLAAIAASGAFLNHATSQEKPQAEETATQLVMGTGTATAEIGADSGFEQGAATQAYKAATVEGALEAFDEAGVSVDREQIEATVDAMPSYAEARDAVTEASEASNFIPDENDTVTVETEVAVNQDGEIVSSDVVSASYEDKPNNQK